MSDIVWKLKLKQTYLRKTTVQLKNFPKEESYIIVFQGTGL